MLNSIIVIPLQEKPYILPQFGINVDPFPEQCESCNLTADPYALTFNISFSANLTQFEETGVAPAVLASTSFPNPNGWWVAANTTNATDYLRALDQTWSLGGGCYGRPGRLYVVVCFPREGITFNQGDPVDGPPFDDRCAAIGTRCGGTCGISIKLPPNCTNDFRIPLDLIMSPRGLQMLKNLENTSQAASPALFSSTFNFSTSVIDTNTTDNNLIVVSGGSWTFCFLFFSYLSLIIFLVNHCAPIAAFLEACQVRFDSASRRDTPWASTMTPDAWAALPEGVEPVVKVWKGQMIPCSSLDDMYHKTDSMVMIVSSVFAGERTFHIFRNILGVYTSWKSLHQVRIRASRTMSRRDEVLILASFW